MKNFISNRICLYSSPVPGRSSAYEIAEYAAKFGVAGIELMNFCDELRTPDMKAAREIGAHVKSLGLATPCFSAGINIAGDDRREALERLKGYADICSELEIPYLHHTIFPLLREKLTPEGAEEIFRIGIESALEIYDYSERLGVKTLVEDQGLVFNGVKNYRRFMEMTDWKIGTVLDFGNIMFVDERPEDFADAFMHNVRHVHIKDYKYLSPSDENSHAYESISDKRFVGTAMGEGDVGIDILAAKLTAADYGGYYSLEYDGLKSTAAAELDLHNVAKSFVSNGA